MLIQESFDTSESLRLILARLFPVLIPVRISDQLDGEGGVLRSIEIFVEVVNQFLPAIVAICQAQRISAASRG